MGRAFSRMGARGDAWGRKRCERVGRGLESPKSRDKEQYALPAPRPDLYTNDPAKFGREKINDAILAMYYFISSSACRIGAADALMKPAKGCSMSRIKFTATATEK